MKKIFFILFIVILNISSFAYETPKGKIDMHGGKSDPLSSKDTLNMAIGLGKVLNKKNSDSDSIKDKKNFMKIEKIEKIEDVKEEND